MSYLSATCHGNFVLPLQSEIIFVEMMLPKGLEGNHLQHLQGLEVQSIHVIDGAYQKSESALPA